jgi:hypothetical protein
MVCKSQLLRASNAEWNRTTDNKQPIIISVVVSGGAGAGAGVCWWTSVRSLLSPWTITNSFSSTPPST